MAELELHAVAGHDEIRLILRELADDREHVVLRVMVIEEAVAPLDRLRPRRDVWLVLRCLADEEGIHHGLGIEIMAEKERDQRRP